MSAPIVELTVEQRAEIYRLECVMGEAHERIRQIHIEAAEADGYDPIWLARHA